jgi:hypothetical protein
MCLTDGTLDSCLSAVGHLLRDEDREVVAVAELLLLGAAFELGVEAADRGKMQTAEETVKVDGLRVQIHHAVL